MSSMMFSDQIRKAVDSCGLSRYRIAKETEIPESSLSRFLSGDSGLSLASLDRVAELLRLKVEMVGPRKTVLAKPRRTI